MTMRANTKNKIKLIKMMRRNGLTFSAIGMRLRMSKQAAHKLFNSGKK